MSGRSGEKFGSESMSETITADINGTGPLSIQVMPTPEDHSYLYDHSNPALAQNWSSAKKLFVAITGLLINFNTCLSAALPTGALDTLTLAFNVTSKQEKALPVAVFLIGYIFGPLIFGPMSESFGRRICFLSSFGLYTLSTLACALAPNWSSLLVFRSW
ncbi:Major facilitator superfamily general substrate transporter protein [Rutstroemia sp. NJR-2017a WRK4]|nr:Major facilitator superfamily general substrate transporter protein [Rutstroemia sp. NJR-2017a WRK4]